MGNLRKLLAWFLGVVNDRVDCPKCGGYRTGVLLGEWGGEMRECFACKHYWLIPNPYMCERCEKGIPRGTHYCGHCAYMIALYDPPTGCR